MKDANGRPVRSFEGDFCQFLQARSWNSGTEDAVPKSSLLTIVISE
jgi:hypothetical protein